MVLDRSDLDLSRQVEMLGRYSTESFEKTVLEKYLKEGQTVLDIGANLGFYSLLARSIIGPKGKIFSFEASKDNAKMIDMSIMENSFENMDVINVAVGNKIGKGFLHVSSFYNSEHSLYDYHYSSGRNSDGGGDCRDQKISVHLETVDNFLENNKEEKEKDENLNADVIKMDIEGAESSALEGMRRTINHNDDLVLVTEFWPQGFKNSNSNPKEFLESLDSFGFKISHIDEYKNELYAVTTNEMLNITKDRQKNPVEKTKEIQSGGWYTNLLCVKAKK